VRATFVVERALCATVRENYPAARSPTTIARSILTTIAASHAVTDAI